MKIEPLQVSDLQPGTIVVIYEKSARAWGNEDVIPRRLRVVVREEGELVYTDALNNANLGFEGKWSRSMIEGIIKKEDVDQFLMWDALTQKVVNE